MYKLTLNHHFSSAHQLVNAYDDKCNDSIHGHNWKVIVKIEQKELVKNMVVDFTKIKEVIDKLDHKNLNEILDFETTAENLSKYLHDQIKQIVLGKVRIILFETDKASIEYEN